MLEDTNFIRNHNYFKVRKEKQMKIILIIAAIILLVVGILGLFPSIGWANVPLWRAILEIVVGGLVLVIGVRSR